MKRLLILLLAASIETATATPPEAQDRYEEWLGYCVETNTVYELMCVSHRRKVGDYTPCNNLGRQFLDSLGLVRTAAGDKSLAQTWGFSIDAGFAEVRRCVSLIRGKALLPALRALDPKQARQKCLDSIMADTMTEFPKANPNDVCLSDAEIRSNLGMIIGEIEAGKTCEPWNFN